MKNQSKDDIFRKFDELYNNSLLDINKKLNFLDDLHTSSLFRVSSLSGNMFNKKNIKLYYDRLKIDIDVFYLLLKINYESSSIHTHIVHSLLAYIKTISDENTYNKAYEYYSTYIAILNEKEKSFTNDISEKDKEIDDLVNNFLNKNQ